MALTLKKRRYAEELLKTRNNTEAAKRAGYSPRTAKSQGSRLRQDPDVQAYIAEHLEEAFKATGVTLEATLELIDAVMFFDPRAVVTFGKNGVSLKESEEIDQRSAWSIAGVSEGKDGQLTVRFVDRAPFAKMACDYLDMRGPRRHEHTGPGGKPLIPIETFRSILAGEDIEIPE